MKIPTVQSIFSSFLLHGRKSTDLQLVQHAKPVPVLIVQDPFTQCTVHLVGVSHGSTSSSNLVKDTILKIKPSSVVLELCDERYLAICLESQIRPSGNVTMAELYNKKSTKLIESKERLKQTGGVMAAYINFVKKQGIIIGAFVTIGLLVSSFQRALRKSDHGDEFTTAMKAAEYLNIPIKLGDAQQSETLRNVRKVVSADTVNPAKVVQNAQSLVFSALGLPIDKLPGSSNLSTQANDAIRRSKWINIPLVYVQDQSLILSLIPLISISLFTMLLGYVPLLDHKVDGGGDGSSLGSSTLMLAQMQAMLGKVVLPAHFSAGKHLVALSPAVHLETFKQLFALAPQVMLPPLVYTYMHQLADVAQPVLHKIVQFASTEPSPAFTNALDSLADVLSFLILVSLAKIIGSDRDRVIASKIRDACKTNPVSDPVRCILSINLLQCACSHQSTLL